MDLFIFSISFLTGVFLSSIWEIYFKGTLDLDPSILEHYHAGLALFIIAHYIYPSFFIGLGTALIFDERIQDHPFAIGKKDSIYSHVIGICLLILNILVRIWTGVISVAIFALISLLVVGITAFIEIYHEGRKRRNIGV